METNNTISKPRLWTGRIMSIIVILFMLMDGVMKFVKPEPVIASIVKLGYQDHHIVWMGLLALIPTILYAIPQTAILGIVLLTGFWGGAMNANFRIDEPLISHILFPVYLAILGWGGLWLRDARLRAIFPVRS
jgi:hypothetical protein